ncbi:hypothetical protein CRE_04361 [Caenorhabditis remanei]|uniref:Uncharacterized protein n=1 Tax=Caenorhabditis remanei TaxID=31234 RepID=E3NIB5_CAERE|nr:hypothetical protein CRE_04361 [Caenorhabditis remanei]
MSLTQPNDDTDLIKYTIPNYGLSDRWEWLQYLNRLVALITCIALHCYILVRLAIMKKLSDYQILIIIQSSINIMACLFELILNEVQTQNLQIIKIGHPFWNFSLNQTLFFTISMVLFSNATQDFLMLFNLHRMVLIKKGNLLRMYALATPLMLFGTGADVQDSYSLVMKGQDINLFYKYGQLPVITLVIVFCYVKLNREFSKITISEKTRKLQQKLSTSVMLQIVILGIVSFIVNFIPWLFKKYGNPSYYNQHIVMYIIVSLVITEWYLLISAILIAWSITGFFHN